MPLNDRLKLVSALTRFQCDEWDNLTDEQFASVSDTILLVTKSLERDNK